MGRAELQFQNFTRGGLKVELCQSERSLRKVWQFRAAIFRGEMQKEDRDIWDDTYLNFCIKCIDTNTILGCFRLGIFPNGAAAMRGYSAQFFDLSPLAVFDRPCWNWGALPLIHSMATCGEIPMSFVWPGALSRSWSIKTMYNFCLGAVHLKARARPHIERPFAIFTATIISRRAVGALFFIAAILWLKHWTAPSMAM